MVNQCETKKISEEIVEIITIEHVGEMVGVFSSGFKFEP